MLSLTESDPRTTKEQLEWIESMKSDLESLEGINVGGTCGQTRYSGGKPIKGYVYIRKANR